MALDYAQSAALMADGAFSDRVKVACLHYAAYIVNEPSNVPAHSTRVRWGQATLVNPDSAVAQVLPTVIMDGQVQADGAAITDQNLQTAVETAVNKLL
jgi:hypothetical protein